jgi:hypothetical protein
MKLWFTAAAAVLLAGCASRSSEISASYVSPVTYQNYTCQQLGLEAQAVSARAATVSGAQDQKRTNDSIATGVAIVVFWPAAFFVSGDGPVAAELANLKGQMVAIEQASIQRNCGISFQRSAEAGGGAPPYVQPMPPPAPPSASAHANTRSKTKQTPPPPLPPIVQALPPEPPGPATSERDGAMNSRN